MPRQEFSSFQEMYSPSGGEPAPAVLSTAPRTIRKTFALMDVKGSIVYIDQSLARELGGDPQTLAGKSISTLIPKERLEWMIRGVVESGIPCKLPGAWLSFDSDTGSDKNESYLLPITADSGKVTGVVLCRIARATGGAVGRSRNSGKKTKTLFDSISIPLLIVNIGGKILEANSAACEYLGRGRNELAGLALHDMVPSGWMMAAADAVEEARRQGLSRFEAPLRGTPGASGLSEIAFRSLGYGNTEALLAEIRAIPVPAAEKAGDDGESWPALLAALPVAAFLWKKREMGEGFTLVCWNAAAVAATGGAVLDWKQMQTSDIHIGGVNLADLLDRAGTESAGGGEKNEWIIGGGKQIRRMRLTAGPIPRGMVLLCAEEVEEPEVRERDLRELKNGLRSISEEVTLAEERERLRIAADIHDGVSQFLALAHFQLEELEAGMSPGASRVLAGSIREHVMQAIHSARSLSHGLCPPILRECGLKAAAEWLVGHFGEDHGISACFSGDAGEKRLEWHLELLLFKMLRELLQNVGKHARAKQVRVSLRNADGRVQMIVEDDGIGFDPSKTSPSERKGGFGLYSIRERLRYIGGECAIDSAFHQGTRCTVNIPIGNDRQPQREYDEYQNNHRR